MIGLTGKMCAGKDTVCERMIALYPNKHFVRFGFADLLKESAAALLECSVEELNAWKNDENFCVALGVDDYCEHKDVTRLAPTIIFTVREFLQRYGTEAHRSVFGDNFWVDAAMRKVDEMHSTCDWSGSERKIPVFTDVRFDNEALAVIGAPGVVIEVIGNNNDTGDHASEAGVSSYLKNIVIDNSVRDDGFDSLDKQIKSIVSFLEVNKI